MRKRDIHIHVHTQDNSEFESKHPRGKGGLFGSGAGTKSFVPGKLGAGSSKYHNAKAAEHAEHAKNSHNQGMKEFHEAAAEAHRQAGHHLGQGNQAQAAVAMKAAKQAERDLINPLQRRADMLIAMTARPGADKKALHALALKYDAYVTALKKGDPGASALRAEIDKAEAALKAA